MGNPISVDRRHRVCQAVQEGLSCRKAAKGFKISASNAIRWVQLLNTADRSRCACKPDIESRAH